uniref:Uncharacterized protein n=1 Tax=Globodera rostochiensis TaxID=31243 RepID=A0A914H1D0_GLORO
MQRFYFCLSLLLSLTLISFISLTEEKSFFTKFGDGFKKTANKIRRGTQKTWKNAKRATKNGWDAVRRNVG